VLIGMPLQHDASISLGVCPIVPTCSARTNLYLYIVVMYNGAAYVPSKSALSSSTLSMAADSTEYTDTIRKLLLAAGRQRHQAGVLVQRVLTVITIADGQELSPIVKQTLIY
jgi:hypothetical protein